MSKFITVLSNELIKIEEYKNPRVCFNDTKYDDIDIYCILKETINPFQMFKENQRLLETSKAYKKLLKTTMQKEHKATHLIEDLKEWLYEQEHKSWDDVSHTFAYVRDKIEELENERV